MDHVITDPRGLSADDVRRLNAAYHAGYTSRFRRLIPLRFGRLAALADEYRTGYRDGHPRAALPRPVSSG